MARKSQIKRKKIVNKKNNNEHLEILKKIKPKISLAYRTSMNSTVNSILGEVLDELRDVD